MGLPRYRHQPRADLQHLALDPLIRDQIKAGFSLVRLKAEDWTSGEINWLFDVIAPHKKTTAAVIGTFKQVAKKGELRMHPAVGRLVDPETLKNLGATAGGGCPIALNRPIFRLPNGLAALFGRGSSWAETPRPDFLLRRAPQDSQ